MYGGPLNECGVGGDGSAEGGVRRMRGHASGCRCTSGCRCGVGVITCIIYVVTLLLDHLNII
jgi:hypothetical protein